MATFVDTHCHLYFNSFDNDLPAVIQRAEEAGVTRMVVPGIDLASSIQAVQLSERFASVYAAVGVHPNDARSWQNGTLDRLRELAAHSRVVAIGEIGLDYYRDRTSHELQRKVLLEQLDLASQMEKPLILHSRAALDELMAILGNWQDKMVSNGSRIKSAPGVLHSFEGDRQVAQIARERGFFIGLGGPITYRNAATKQELVKDLKLETILVETDAPFLAPHPLRGQRNEPAYVRQVAEKLAELQQCSLEAVATTTSRNAAILFRWSDRS